MVDPVEDLGESRAEQEVGESPVGEKVDMRFVRDCFAGTRGAKAKGCEDRASDELVWWFWCF